MLRLGLILSFCATLLPVSVAQVQSPKPPGTEPIPEPAVAAILQRFDKYEVVGIPEGHGMKDIDDFLLLLIRHPRFSEKVNDIVVECGNSLYQPLLDRYMAGENVPFAEVRKVWRNTTQPMCSLSGFFEQFFPLVRAMNQKLPEGRRLRVLAGDPPIDWGQVKTAEDSMRYMASRDENIASIMKKEVLSRHRKALMLFGTYHLFHGVGRLSAVSIYETEYPNITFVMDGLGGFDAALPFLSGSPFADWPMPALASARGTWLGALDISHFYPVPVYLDEKCNVHRNLPKELQKPMAELVDGFLYVVPQDWALREAMPAAIALDAEYMTEVLRRSALQGYPGAGSMTLKAFNEQTIESAEYPLYGAPKSPDAKVLVQECLDRQARKHSSE